jgi:uncharacterized protein YjiS (DUF1127 family)
MQATEQDGLGAAALTRVARTIGGWQELQRERDALRELDADALRDIGLTPHEAREESNKPFWHIPEQGHPAEHS